MRTSRGHALTVRLAGKGKNRNGIGARVTVFSGKKSMPALVHAGHGYLSSDDGTLHFGLGHRTTADAIEVRWPNGKITHLDEVPADVPLTIAEP